MSEKLTLSTEYFASTRCMRMRLHNASETALSNFSLCFTLASPPKVENITNANTLHVVGSFVELQHPNLVLAPYTSWVFSIEIIDVQFFHASDQAANPFVVLHGANIGSGIQSSVEYREVVSLPPRYIARNITDGETQHIIATGIAHPNNLLASPANDTANSPIISTASTSPVLEYATIIPQPQVVDYAQGVLDCAKGFSFAKNIDSALQSGIDSFNLFIEDLGLAHLIITEGGMPIMVEHSKFAISTDKKAAANEEASTQTGLKASARESEANEQAILKTSNKLCSGTYQLDIHAEGITIASSTAQGLFYACISVLQLFQADTSIPYMHIEDTARFSWRGMMLDTARQYYSVAEIKRIIRLLALHKLNVFHWHISDDEAWRIELEAYPQLAQRYGYRGYEALLPPFFGSGYKISGGIYTKDDIQEVVSYASRFGITVVPELDVPGHSMALIKALPELQEVEDKSKYLSVQGYEGNVLNPALESTYTVLEHIIKEMSEVFSGQYFHFGCDERAEHAWTLSPACRTLLTDHARLSTNSTSATTRSIANEIASNTTNAMLGKDDLRYLQNYFVSRIEAMLHKHGKTGMAWEEAITQGSVYQSTIIFSWKGVEAGLEAAARGYKVVMCPGQYYYLDMAQSAAVDDIGLSWAGIATLQDAYNYEAIPDISAVEQSAGKLSGLDNVIGLQANLWSENLWDKSRVDYMLFPRLAAIAESSWSAKERKDFAQFAKRLHTMYFPFLDSLGVGYKPDF